MFLKKITLKNLLSFEDDFLELRQLNVFIGHNGSGKSNLIEAVGLLQSTPWGIAGTIREGGGVDDWIWKGADKGATSSIEAIVKLDDKLAKKNSDIDLRYQLNFQAVNRRFEIVDERVENEQPMPGKQEPRYYFFYQNGYPVINAGNPDDLKNRRRLERATINPEKSILAQMRDPVSYPELSWIGDKFGSPVGWARFLCPRGSHHL